MLCKDSLLITNSEPHNLSIYSNAQMMTSKVEYLSGSLVLHITKFILATEKLDKENHTHLSFCLETKLSKMVNHHLFKYVIFQLQV